LSDTWLTAKIFVNQWQDKEEVIRRLISPLVRDFERESWFKTFHFLSYGNKQEGLFLRFRVNLSDEKKEFLRDSIERRMKNINETTPVIKSTDYSEAFIENPETMKGERARFGEFGLKIFLNYFEYVSRTVIGLLERPATEANEYPIKYRMTLELFHFLLNPLLYQSFDGDGEVSAHTQAINERLRTLSLLQSSVSPS